MLLAAGSARRLLLRSMPSTFGDRKPGHEGHHHDAAVLRQQREDVVGHVARHVVHRARRGVREDHRRLADARARRPSSRATRGTMSTSMPSRFISRTTSSPNGVRPPCSGASVAESAHGDVLRVRERHVAGAEPVEHAQHAERAVDRVPAFDADERRDLARLEDPLDVVGRQRQLERLGIRASSGGRRRSARASR